MGLISSAEMSFENVDGCQRTFTKSCSHTKRSVAILLSPWKRFETLFFARYCVINKYKLEIACIHQFIAIVNFRTLQLCFEHEQILHFYNSAIIQVTMETKLRYETKIACVLLNTWALELDLPNKMIYMDMYI